MVNSPEQTPSSSGEIPHPVETGADGEQVIQEFTSLAVVEANTRGLPHDVGTAVVGLAEENPSKLGGAVGARLLAASFSELQARARSLENQLTDERSNHKTTSENLGEANTKIAVLEQQLDSLSQSTAQFSTYRALLSTLGALLFGLGTSLLESRPAPAVALILVSLIMLGLSWARPKGG